jgi:hypothetical protein
MTVVGLGGITSGAGGEHRAARVDAKRMGHGGGEASGQGMGGGDNLRPRQVGGGGMVVRVVYTIVLINSRDYLSVWFISRIIIIWSINVILYRSVSKVCIILRSPKDRGTSIILCDVVSHKINELVQIPFIH